MTSDRRHGVCPSDGVLRALLDGEADAEHVRHVTECGRCSTRLDMVRAAAAQVDALLADGTLLDSEASVDVPVALGRFRRRLSEEDDGQQRLAGVEHGGVWMSHLWMRRGTRVATAFVAIIAMVTAFAVSPMRTVADDFLNQFRVQKFAAVTIPMDLVEPLQSGMLQSMSETDKDRIKQELDELGTFETTFQLDMTSLPTPTTVDGAEAQFGDIAVPDDLPEGVGEPTVYVTQAGSASYELNVDKAQEIIDGLGLPIYAFDQVTAETLTFTANVSEAAILHYRDGATNIVVGQTASPTLDIPEGFDMNALREDILRFPGLPTDLVAQLRSIDDWENTLIVPIPENAESRDVTVNGRAGLLIEMEQGSAVLWEDGGTLFAVAGQASADEVMDIAESMD